MIISESTNILRLVISFMAGIQGCSFEFIFSEFQTETSIFATDNVEFTNHIIMINQILRIDVKGKNAFTGFISSDTFLELHFALGIPGIFLI